MNVSPWSQAVELNTRRVSGEGMEEALRAATMRAHSGQTLAEVCGAALEEVGP
jgi:hypothetical protein